MDKHAIWKHKAMPGVSSYGSAHPAHGGGGKDGGDYLDDFLSSADEDVDQMTGVKAKTLNPLSIFAN